MFKEMQPVCRRIACAIVIGGIAAVSLPANAEPVFLGPANPGAKDGFTTWYYGVHGTGLVAIDTDDPASGNNDFKIGITNTAFDPENKADLRSHAFPLGAAADGRGPITFSFVYKLPDEAVGKDNLLVTLRFFDAGSNFLNQKTIPIGSRTHDSVMTSYKRMVIPNIRAPKGAQMADIWVTANIFGRWTSGSAQFDDFSVTTVPAWRWVKILVSTGLGFCLMIALMLWMRYSSRKRAKI